MKIKCSKCGNEIDDGWMTSNICGSNEGNFFMGYKRIDNKYVKIDMESKKEDSYES